MKYILLKTRTAVALALLIVASVPVTTQGALACSPEIKFDPITGVALPQPDLEAALAAIENSIAMADVSPSATLSKPMPNPKKLSLP